MLLGGSVPGNYTPLPDQAQYRNDSFWSKNKVFPSVRITLSKMAGLCCSSIHPFVLEYRFRQNPSTNMLWSSLNNTNNSYGKEVEPNDKRSYDPFARTFDDDSLGDIMDSNSHGHEDPRSYIMMFLKGGTTKRTTLFSGVTERCSF